jgi:hypothetical protein
MGRPTSAWLGRVNPTQPSSPLHSSLSSHPHANSDSASRSPLLAHDLAAACCCSSHRRPCLVLPNAAAAPPFSPLSLAPRHIVCSSSPGNPSRPPGSTPAITGRFRRRRSPTWLLHIPLHWISFTVPPLFGEDLLNLIFRSHPLQRLPHSSVHARVPACR